MGFVGSEIVELGVQIEINGRDFYNRIAEKTKDKKVKEVFRYLAEQEAAHIIVFRKILGSVEEYEPKQSYPQEYFAYMNALASDYIFTKKEAGNRKVETITNEIEAVDIAIGFEKDSITFYEGMKRIVGKKDKKLLDKLIVQEQSHLNSLLEIKRKN